MPNNPLQPGERVVELAAVAQSVAIFSGAISAAITAWVAKRSWAVSAASLLVGAVLGFVVGLVVARLMYRTADGMTTIVRVGGSSLLATIRAALSGGLATAVVIGGAAVLLLSAPAQSAFSTAIVCGAIIGVAFAFMSSLL